MKLLQPRSMPMFDRLGQIASSETAGRAVGSDNARKELNAQHADSHATGSIVRVLLLRPAAICFP
jgi:hypothetical protein